MKNKAIVLNIAHFTDVIDGRVNSGTARAAREIIFELNKYSGIHQTFIHFEKSTDDIYKLENTNQLLIPLLNFPFAKHFFSFFIFWTKERLLNKSNRFDVVHWHSSRVYPFFFLIPGAKFVITLHDATIRQMKEVNTFWTRVFYWNVRISIKKIDAIIGDSYDACIKLVRFGKFPSNKVARLYLGSNFDGLLPQKPLSFNLPDKYFLCVSRWQPHKNVERLIEGYAQALRDFPELPNLVLVGKPVSGHNLPILKLQEFKLADRVTVLEDLKDSELAFMYDHAILNISPSLHEGFGFTVLEGLKRNCPSLDHAFTSTSEISGSAGIHIDMTSTKEIAEALLLFVKNPRRRFELVGKTNERASLFTWERTAVDLIGIYLR